MTSELYKGDGFGRLPTPEESAALESARLNRSNLPQTKIGQPIIMVRNEDGRLRRLISCGNYRNPRLPDFEFFFVASAHAMENPKMWELELADRRKWLDKMVHADPLPNERYTTEQLKALGLIGLYLWQDVPECELGESQ